MVLIAALTNTYGSRKMEFEVLELVYRFESCKIVFLGGTSYSLVQAFLL